MATKAKQAKDAVEVLVDVDGLLTYHLNHAEDHLIEAVKLFERKIKPERHINYLARLTRAQEMVTLLHREELFRIRGPIKATAKATAKKMSKRKK